MRNDKRQQMKRCLTVLLSHRSLCVATALLVSGIPIRADLMQSGDLSLTSGGNDLLPGTGRSFSGYVWTGDGTRLNMSGFYIRNVVDTNGFTLNMAGGGITNGGDLSTARADNTGSIAITNAGNIAVGMISTLPTTGYGNSGSISISHTGSLTATGLTTAVNIQYDYTVGSITLKGGDGGPLNVVANGISSRKNTTPGSSCGAISIQDYTAVTINGPVLSAPGRGTIAIGSSLNRIGGPIAISGAIDTVWAVGNLGADVGLYSSGSVSVAGILAGYSMDSYNSYRPAGAINVSCAGSFTCGGITNGSDRDTAIHAIVVDGTDSSGSYVSGSIDTHKSSGDGVCNGNPVTIRNFSSVTINGGVRTDIAVSDGWNPNGGSFTATNITGDIAITGEINLNGYGSGTDGALTLATTGRQITLGSLNLSNVGQAVISPGSKCIVTGDLAGFNTNVTAQTQLRMPTGKRMLYYPGLTNNAYLLGGVYVLANPDGTPASGGTLRPYVSPGTVITLK